MTFFEHSSDQIGVEGVRLLSCWVHQRVGLEWNTSSGTSIDGLLLEQEFRYLRHDQTIHDGAVGCWAPAPGLHHPETKRHPRLACRKGRSSVVCHFTNEPWNACGGR